jgi:hypothetical protein
VIFPRRRFLVPAGQELAVRSRGYKVPDGLVGTWAWMNPAFASLPGRKLGELVSRETTWLGTLASCF